MFEGKWYQIHRYPNENNVQCVELSFNKTTDTNYTLHIHGMENTKMVHENAEIFIDNGVLKINDSKLLITLLCLSTYNTYINRQTV